MSFELTKLGEIAKILNGFAFKSQEYVEEGIRVIRIANVQKGFVSDDSPKFIALGREKEFEKYMLNNGDVLISLTGNVGRVGIIKEDFLPAALNQRVGKIAVTSDKVFAPYVFHLLNSNEFENAAIKNSKGIAQLNLSTKWIESFSIPLPKINNEINLEEQKRIAGILDAADALRAKRRESLAKLDDLLQSTFLDMFGDPVTNPKSWEVRDLSDSVYIQGGFAFKSKDYCDDGIRLVKISNVHSENLKWDEVDHVPYAFLEKYKEFALKPKDLVIALTRPIIKSLNSVKIATVGKEDSPSLLNQRVARFLFSENSKVGRPYLLAFCQTLAFKNKVQKFCSESLQPNMSTKQLGSVQIPTPPLELQQRFAEIVSSAEDQKAKMKKQLEQLDDLFASLQQRAFRGDL